MLVWPGVSTAPSSYLYVLWDGDRKNKAIRDVWKRYADNAVSWRRHCKHVFQRSRIRSWKGVGSDAAPRSQAGRKPGGRLPRRQRSEGGSQSRLPTEALTPDWFFVLGMPAGGQ